MRLAAFIIALLLLAGSVDPTRGWLIALVVVSALAVARPRTRWFFELRPRLEAARIATLVLAALLLAGTIDPTRDWLIGLTAVAGVSAFMPRMLGGISFDDDDHGWARRLRRRHGRAHRWQLDWDGDDWA